LSHGELAAMVPISSESEEAVHAIHARPRISPNFESS
jgi:hypothetical protein